MLAAGLEGIEKGYEPPPSTEWNVYELTAKERKEKGIGTLPGSLGEAADHLEQPQVPVLLIVHDHERDLRDQQLQKADLRHRVLDMCS